VRGRAQNIGNNSDPRSYPQHSLLPSKPPVFPHQNFAYVLVQLRRSNISFPNRHQVTRNNDVVTCINIRLYSPSGWFMYHQVSTLDKIGNVRVS
jgi:hypothetical protein